MEKLNGIVWPAMAESIKNVIQNVKEDVVVVEAAVLLKAGWEKLCHEVLKTNYFLILTIFISSFFLFL